MSPLPDTRPTDIDARMATVIDEQLGRAVAEGRSSAAVAIFVANGGVRFEKAYGWEDATRAHPVTAEDSLFELNSLVKTFTSVALTRLKSEGRITSLEDPVNKYLRSYKFAESYGQPITLHELVTHTAGLDQSNFATGAPYPSLAVAVRNLDPGYYRPPGTVTAYSSYSDSVLRLLVSDLVGEPFDVYARRSIFVPLGMDHTRTYESKHESVGSATFSDLPHEVLAFDPNVPAPQSTRNAEASRKIYEGTAQDMARYMLALADRNGQQSVITDSMQQDMFKVQQSNGALGEARGVLFDLLRVGQRTIVNHAANGDSITCYMGVDPGAGMGIFYCFTLFKPKLGAKSARQPLDHTLVKEAVLSELLFGGSVQDRTVDQSQSHDAFSPSWKAYLGDYLTLGRHHAGISRLRSLLHPEFIRVTQGAAGLKINGIDGYTEVASGGFQAPGVLDNYQFFVDPFTKKMTVNCNMMQAGFQKPDLFDDPRIVRTALGAIILIGMTGLLAPFWKGVKSSGRLAAVAFAAVMMMALVTMYGFHAFGDRYFEGIRWPLIVLRVLSFLVIPIGFYLTLGAVSAWRQRLVALPGRLHMTILASSACIAIVVLASVDLISFSRLH